jgi:hypothetical protein
MSSITSSFWASSARLRTYATNASGSVTTKS